MGTRLVQATPDMHHPCRVMRPLAHGERIPAVPSMLEQVFYLLGEQTLITLAPMTDLEADDDIDLDLLFELAA